MGLEQLFILVPVLFRFHLFAHMLFLVERFRRDFVALADQRFDFAFDLVQLAGAELDQRLALFKVRHHALEAEFAAYCGAGQAVGVGSGMDALALTLSAAGIGAGAEVIVPAHTFAATWMAVEAVGASLVAVEAAPDTYTVTAEAVPEPGATTLLAGAAGVWLSRRRRQRV